MATATKAPDTSKPPLTVEQRLTRIEQAINSLRYLDTRLAHIPPGVHIALDEIAQENFANLALAGAPRLFEQRPHQPAETRADKRIGGAAND